MSFEDFVKERIYLKGVSPRTVEWYKESFKWLGIKNPSKTDLTDFVMSRSSWFTPLAARSNRRNLSAFRSSHSVGGSTAAVPGPKIPDCGKVSECVARVAKGPVIPVDGCYWFAPKIVVSRVVVDLIKRNLMERQIAGDLRRGARSMDHDLPAIAAQNTQHFHHVLTRSSQDSAPFPSFVFRQNSIEIHGDGQLAI
jgi:hypothetical protein